MQDLDIRNKPIATSNVVFIIQNMIKSTNKNLTIPFLLIDFLLVNIAFFGMNFIKRNSFELDVKYLKLLFLFYFVWAGVSYYTKKFKLSSYPDYKHAFLLILKSNLFVVYALSLAIVLQGLYAFSRIQLFGTCLILFLLELTSFSAFYITKGKEIITKNRSDQSILLRFKNF